MKVSKIYITLLIILLLFTDIVSAEHMEIKNGETVEIQPLTTVYSSRQVLYSLLVMEIAADNVKELQLSNIKVSQEIEDRNMQLIYQDEYLQIIKDNWELVLNKDNEKSKSMVISNPQIVVIPGHTGYLSVGQEDITIDYSANGKMLTRENTLRLEITPERAFRSDSILTRIKMQTGNGETGLETEAWISSDKPQLLGIVKSTERCDGNTLTHKSQDSKNRYFVLYLTAQPTGIIAFPAFSGSLNGLEQLFEYKKRMIDKNLIGVCLWNDGKNNEVNVFGDFQSNTDLKLKFNYNQILSGESSIGVTGQISDGLWLGCELIYGDGDGFSTVVDIVDSVKLGPVKLVAGISPIVYNIGREERSTRYFLSSETSLNEELKLILAYHSQGKSDYAKARLDYKLNSVNSLMMGYMIEFIEGNVNKNSRGYCLGVSFKL